jgi:hypothetical protein
MIVLGFLVCAVAAYRLTGTPLYTTALGVAVANGACLAWRFALLSRSAGEPPRLVTALSHVTTALAAFFLFVSFALR